MALGVALGVADGDGVWLGVADGVALGVAEGVALGVADGVAEAEPPSNSYLKIVQSPRNVPDAAKVVGV